MVPRFAYHLADPSFVGEFDLQTTEGYVLQVTAGVDAVSRTATWLLRAIDPRDGLPPRDASIGLLKPGAKIQVGFWVEAETVAAFGTGGDVKTGDRIEMTSRAIFDEGVPQDSEPTTATLDAVAPVSDWTVTPLGANRFQVNWSAEDDAGGAGVVSYSLLVSTDGGSRYRTVLYSTTSTQTVYRAEPNETPTFLVRAIDAAGNVESAPAGVTVPRLAPAINLGTPPVAPVAIATEIPKAVPTTSNVQERLFTEAAFGLNSRISATQPSRFSNVVRPLAAERFATLSGISGASIGSLAMASSPDGKWLYASGGNGRNELVRIPLTTSSREPQKLSSLTSPIYELAFDAAGQLWASTGGEGLLQLDPVTGTVIDSFGVGVALGIASIPGQTALYVATAGGVLKFNTATRTFEAFSDIRVDSLAVDADGTLYGTQWPSGGSVLRFDFRGRASSVSTIRDAESIAFGAKGTLLEGVLVVGHQDSGRLTLLDPKSLKEQVIASGGIGRVEGIEVLPDGKFFVTQGEQIDAFVIVAAPRVIETKILDGNNRATIAFDVSLQASDSKDPTSASNPNNYSLKNLDTNELIPIGSIRYDEATRTAGILFETLPPAPYRLTVAPQVESEQGIQIGGQGASVDFRVFENVSAVMPVSFSNTRINRHDGTVLVDVQVTNNGAFDLAGPIQIVFEKLVGDNVTVLVNGAPSKSSLLELYSNGTVLKAGERSTVQTLVVTNPRLLELNFAPSVRASLPPNKLPEFLSTPIRSASVGQSYSYSATANDPDGSNVTYVLSGAPTGATVNSVTGQIQWQPSRWTDPTTQFELRAYDSRGAYRRQTWKVDVTGANRAPIVAPIADQQIQEGDMLELPVSAFDPDGDSVFYFADGLPPGAVFDSYSQVLRWRPSANASGEYPTVSLIASDGFSETRESFSIVVTNKNTAPTLAPLNDVALREGDTISFRLHGSDSDGDRLRYYSPNLPPGAFLDPNTGLFEWIPGFDQHGVYAMQFFADDGKEIAKRSATLTVSNINGQVAFTELPTFELFEGQSIKLRIAATDPEYPTSTNNPFDVSDDFFVDQGEKLAPLNYTHATLPAGAIYDPVTQLFSWTPTFVQSGRYELQFGVNDDGDGTGTSSSDNVTLVLNIKDANGRPKLDAIANASVAVSNSLEIPIRAVDPEGGSIKLSVQIGQSTSLPSWASFVDHGDGTGVLTVQPQPGNRDNYAVTVTATESSGLAPLSDSTQFILQVTSPNEPPKFSPIFDRVAIAGQAMQFIVSTTDADDDALSYLAENLPAGATFAATGVYGQSIFNWTPSADQIGQHSVTFQVSDDGNGDPVRILTDRKSFTLNVRTSNARPTLDPLGLQSVAEGQKLMLQMSAADSDNDKLFYTASLVSDSGTALPRGVDFDSASGKLEWTPDFTQAGDYRFRLSVTDGAATRSEDVIVQVVQTNLEPVFSVLPKLYGREGDTLFFTVNATDPDAQPLRYSLESVGGDWSQSTLPPGLRFDASSRSLEWQAGFEVAGNYRLNFAAVDSMDAIARLTVDVQILATNRAPSLVLPSLRNAEIGKELVLNVLATDLDGDTLTLSATDLPAGASLDSTGVLRWTPQGFQAGEHVVRVLASDGTLSTRRNITLVATFEPASPDLRLVITPSFPAVPGQKVSIQPIASSDVGLGKATVKIDGVEQELDSLGRVSFIGQSPGRHEIVATITDDEGRTTTISEVIYTRDPSDREAPTVGIRAIVPAILTEPRVVQVDVGDATIAEYVIELIGRDDGKVTRIQSGTTSACHEVTIDPKAFANGFYTLRATARDLGGLESTTTAEIEINSALKANALERSVNDLSISLDGISVEFRRVYSSLSAGSADTAANGVDIAGVSLGNRWSLPMVNPQVTYSRPNQTGFSISAEPLHQGDRLYATLLDGRRVGFTFTPTASLQNGITVYRPAWASDAGVDWTLKTYDQVLQKVGSDNAFYRVGTGLPYNLTLDPGSSLPVSTLMLVAPSGQTYGYAQSGETALGPRFVLERITSSDQTRFLRWTDSGLVASDGTRVSVVRDDSGRIAELVGPNGEHRVYRYDAQDQLITAIDAISLDRTFYSYDDAGRLQIESPSNAAGRLHRYDATNGQWLGASIIADDLSGSRKFLNAPVAGTLGSDGTQSYAFTITDGELRSSSSETLTIGIEVASSSFDPATATLDRLSAGYVRTESGKSLALFTFTKSGTYVLTVRGVNGVAATGRFVVTPYLVGDLDGDLRVDGNDQTLFDAAMGSRDGDANYPTFGRRKSRRLDRCAR